MAKYLDNEFDKIANDIIEGIQRYPKRGYYLLSILFTKFLTTSNTLLKVKILFLLLKYHYHLK